MTMGRLVVFANRVQNGKDCASSKAATIEVIANHRQGNCVSCSGRTRFQRGRDNGVAMNRVNDNTIALATITLLLESDVFLRAARVVKIRAGQNIIIVTSSRIFIHQTLMKSDEKVEKTKLAR